MGRLFGGMATMLYIRGGICHVRLFGCDALGCWVRSCGARRRFWHWTRGDVDVMKSQDAVRPDGVDRELR
jgi:hypothetical protein